MRHHPPPHWRRVLKNALAGAIWRAQSCLAAPWPWALVVGYHRVVENFAAVARTDMPTLLTSSRVFEQHLDTIGRHFRFVTIDDIGRHIERGEPFERAVAAVTFDDGYRDVYEHAFPILKRKGIPGAAFVVTAHIGDPRGHTHDRLYELMAKAYATWEDPRRGLARVLNELGLSAAAVRPERTHAASPFAAVPALLSSLSQAEVGQLIDGLRSRVGLGSADAPRPLTWAMVDEMQRNDVTIGSHTKTHPWLTRESDACAADELAASKEALEARLGRPIDHFAYPGGQFTPSVIDAVARAGYRFAYTACPHADPARPSLTIERLMLWEHSSMDAKGAFSASILNCQAHGLWPPARWCERVHTS
jgi:peptidoglycan/xylan/chitin deacetylase (PgdA/CDA1 family)